jgi:hypothetical protein
MLLWGCRRRCVGLNACTFLGYVGAEADNEEAAVNVIRR